MMTKKDKIDCLMLISALESYCISKSSADSYPDYLLEITSYVVDELKADILGEEK
jgi:hypothetical protein